MQGEDSSDAAVDALKQAFAETATPPVVTPPRAYRPLGGLTTALIVLAALQIADAAVHVVAFLGKRGVFAEQLSSQLLVETVIMGLAEAMFYLASLVVFCIWVHQAYANLIPLGSRRVRFTPGWAVGYFFIPFVNLVRGVQVMRDVWIESQPLPAERAEDATLVRRAPLVNGWWAMWLVMTFSFRSNNYSFPDPMMKAAIEIVAGLLFIAVVRGIARRQREQWEDLVRRQPAPAPADLLR